MSNDEDLKNKLLQSRLERHLEDEASWLSNFNLGRILELPALNITPDNLIFGDFVRCESNTGWFRCEVKNPSIIANCNIVRVFGQIRAFDAGEYNSNWFMRCHSMELQLTTSIEVRRPGLGFSL